MAALDIIESKQPELYRYIKPIFVTVDPLRDTQAQIAAYAENFHPRMRWLTGSHQALTKAAKEFHIYFSIPDDATPDGDYNVDHSIFFFLMDREGKLLSYYGQNKNAVEIAEAMASVVQEDLERDKLESALNARKM
jgi:protein SCO1/2